MYELLQRLHDATRSNKKYDKFDLTPKQFIGLVISLVSNEIRLCCGGKKNRRSEAQTLKAIYTNSIRSTPTPSSSFSCTL